MPLSRRTIRRTLRHVRNRTDQPFRVIDISDVPQGPLEQMGTKDKFWLNWNGDLWLFKNGRPNTGEHWAEKLAEVIGYTLGIPVAEVELATFKEQRGTISKSFLAKSESLIHGNELMSLVVEDYDSQKRFQQSDHRIDHVLQCLVQKVPNDVQQFIGYLTLDALIGNTDRHHENWGLISTPGQPPRIAPSYDHASSFGRELKDEKIERHLQNVEKYLGKGSGGIFGMDGQKCPPSALLADLDQLGYSKERADWRNILTTTDVEILVNAVARIPEGWITDKGHEFASQVIRCGFEQIAGKR